MGYMYNHVFNKLMWHTIGTKELLIWHCTVIFGPDGAVNYDYIALTLC